MNEGAQIAGGPDRAIRVGNEPHIDLHHALMRMKEIEGSLGALLERVLGPVPKDTQEGPGLQGVPTLAEIIRMAPEVDHQVNTILQQVEELSSALYAELNRR